MLRFEVRSIGSGTNKTAWALALAMTALVAKTRVVSCILSAVEDYFEVTNELKRMRGCWIMRLKDASNRCDCKSVRSEDEEDFKECNFLSVT